MRSRGVVIGGLVLWFVVSHAFANEPEIIEIDVRGMTCAFCIYGLEKELKQIDSVSEVHVSLKHKKARLVLRSGRRVDEELIRNTVREAGFTPGNIRQIHTTE